MAIRLFEEASHARIYSQFRPSYPKAVLELITSFASRHGGSTELAVDVACGSGQSTFYLREHFKQCIGVDVSTAQIEEAKRKCSENSIENVHFKLGSDTEIPVDGGTVDVVTCAQGWHWFGDPKAFYKECVRALKAKGCLAIYGYGNVQVANKNCNTLVSNFYSKTLQGYWHERRGHIDNLYKTVDLPFKMKERHDLKMPHPTTLPNFIGYVATWSGYIAYCKRNPGNGMLEDLQKQLQEVLEKEVEGEVLEASFPVFMILGQKD